MINYNFTKFCGIKLTATTTQQSNQNPHAENKIGNLVRSMKKVHAHSGVPLVYGCYGLAYVTLVSNHIPNRSIHYDQPVDRAGFISIHQLLRIFGCLVFYWRHKKTDADITGYPAIFLGFADLQRGYYFLDLQTKEVLVSRYGVFREETLPFIIANNGALLPVLPVRFPTVLEILTVKGKGGGNDKKDDQTSFIGPPLPQSSWQGIIQPHMYPQLPFKTAQRSQSQPSPSKQTEETTVPTEEELENKHPGLIDDYRKIIDDYREMTSDTTITRFTQPSEQLSEEKLETLHPDIMDDYNNITSPQLKLTPKARRHLDLLPLSTIPQLSDTKQHFTSKNETSTSSEDQTYEVERLIQRKPIKAKNKYMAKNLKNQQQYMYQVKWKNCDKLTWPGTACKSN